MKDADDFSGSVAAFNKRAGFKAPTLGDLFRPPDTRKPAGGPASGEALTMAPEGKAKPTARQQVEQLAALYGSQVRRIPRGDDGKVGA
ncbi:MAG: hypothetical protein NVV60_00600 [Luteimonas sp.]|nr:hypothetical protein [Luteimonas sp.]